MADMQLYNTATRRKERVVPIDPQNVRLYACGPTVYDRAHIGNARMMIVFDVLQRVLRGVFGSDHVTYVRNITDVDDKIMTRADETGRTIAEVTEQAVGWLREDLAALGVAPPDHEPRATEHIGGMIEIIETLIERGGAYAAEGHVLFSIRDFESYGALSGRSLDDMRAGARVEVAPYKRDPGDFVLWKPSAEHEPGWESPWGRGRPGWHIECSAMSKALLGETFDIHGGGIDLVFPHHENERAQSLCAHPGSDFARLWMHNGFVVVDGEKMSKSLGNFFTVQDLLGRGFPGEVIRFAMLATHYRQPFDWTDAHAEETRRTLAKWRRIAGDASPSAEPPAGVLDALADDLNTPKAIAEMHALAASGDAGGLVAAGALLGVLSPEMGAWAAEPEADPQTAARIEALLAARATARAQKDFARSDAIRDGLAAAGVIVKDAKDGASWTLGQDFDPGGLEGVDP